MALNSVGQGKKYAVQIEPVVGELLRPIFISEQGFLALQGNSLVLLTLFCLKVRLILSVFSDLLQTN